ncbi:BCCT family transporter [Halanaeroarchaeum sulfurireducens]|uniref:Glycine/betaine ABC transporter n=1 Tax=Halanaeroarchaeum sulfurireducens TaxID=1604004 RepID=A0A0N9NA62_9EURY|nr:BCCT family transporter [Halanaeroarchaeum sulfurireducens]ALG81920.1 glycine/betaine ABC transporter [Halanaeroarchaeum sulfurireducens]
MTDPTENTSRRDEQTVRERFFHADLDRDPGDTNVQLFGIDVHPVVFPLSVLTLAVFVAITIGLGEQAETAYQAVFDSVNRNFGWLYVLAVNVFIVALVGFASSRFGAIRLGGADAEPEFSRLEWLAMLFTAGMGVGLLFFGVAEPMYHFASGGGSFFDVSPETPAAGRAATAITMFHWGFHPWAIYGVVGLGLAFFAFNRGLPLSFRSIFYPLLGDRIYGVPGHVVDLAAVIATIFGLATTVGLASLQINAGLDFLATTYVATGLPTTIWSSVIIIAVIIVITTMSVVAGLERGIRRLSQVNVVLMVTMLLFVVLVGPTVFLLDVFNSGIGSYLGNFLALSFHAEAFAGSDAGWQHGWTIFFWGFWITWAPFVGMFIARISKGRTIREFVGGVLVVPALFSLVWTAAFNGAAIFVELSFLSGGVLGPLQDHGRAVALFEMLSFYPFTVATSLIATVNLVTFAVTSIDSGSLVTSYLTAGGKQELRTRQRVLWPIFIGGTAIVLLVGNGLKALQTAVIATGLPFVVLILAMVYAIYLGLRREVEIQRSPSYQEAVKQPPDSE